MNSMMINNAHIVDPSQSLDSPSNLRLEEGRIVDIGRAAATDAASIDARVIDDSVIDAQGRLLIPGLIDLSAHIKDIAADTHAAAAGGITTVCTLPDSKPVVDTPADVKLILQAAQRAGHCRVLPLGALTQGLGGDQLANMYSLKEAGCIALSNARHAIKNSLVLRRIMEYASSQNVLIMLSAEDRDLAAGGLMHEGPTATRLGLAGIPETAETIALAQQLLLAEQTGCRVHFSQLSCGRSVAMLRDAKRRGLKVSADVSIAHLLYTDEQVSGYNSCFHVHPPLRNESDRQALLQGVNAGELAICSHHRAQELVAKKATFADAEPGMSLLDSWLGMMLSLVDNGELELNAMVNAASLLPASILGIAAGLALGEQANLTLVDVKTRRLYDEAGLVSRGKNSPIIGQSLAGEVLLTFSEGRQVYSALTC